jgi:hypothetical protein
MLGILNETLKVQEVIRNASPSTGADDLFQFLGLRQSGHESDALALHLSRDAIGGSLALLTDCACARARAAGRELGKSVPPLVFATASSFLRSRRDWQ